MAGGRAQQRRRPWAPSHLPPAAARPPGPCSTCRAARRSRRPARKGGGGAGQLLGEQVACPQRSQTSIDALHPHARKPRQLPATSHRQAAAAAHCAAQQRLLLLLQPSAIQLLSLEAAATYRVHGIQRLALGLVPPTLGSTAAAAAAARHRARGALRRRHHHLLALAQLAVHPCLCGSGQAAGGEAGKRTRKAGQVPQLPANAQRPSRQLPPPPSQPRPLTGPVQVVPQARGARLEHVARPRPAPLHGRQVQRLLAAAAAAPRRPCCRRSRRCRRCRRGGAGAGGRGGLPGRGAGPLPLRLVQLRVEEVGLAAGGVLGFAPARRQLRRRAAGRGTAVSWA